MTYANVLATLALFIALGGASALAAVQLGKNSVGSRQLKANAVTGAKVRDGSLAAADFKAGQLPAGPAGPQGGRGAASPKGEPGQKGDPGQNGDPGVSGYVVETSDSEEDSTSPKTEEVFCPVGKKVVGGGAFVTGKEVALHTNTPILDTSPEPDGWLAVAYESKETNEKWALEVHAICVDLTPGEH